MPLVGPEREAWADLQAWAGLLVVAATAYLAARIVTGLGLAVAFAGWRRSEGSHWTERARRAWAGRQLAFCAWVFVPFPLLFFLVDPISFAALGRTWAFSRLVPATAKDLLLIVAAYLGVMRSLFGWECRVNPAAALTPRTRRGTWTFRVVLLALWTWIPYALLGKFLIGRTEVHLAVVVVGVLAIAAYRLGGVFALLRWTGLQRPAPDRLLAVVDEIARRMDIRPRSVEVAALAQANAYALPMTGRLIVMDPALAVLDDDELAVTCAHELAHLGEPRWVAIARLLYALLGLFFIAPPLILVSLAGWPDAFGAVFAGFLLLLIPGLIAIVLFQRLYRRMEVRADAMASAVEVRPGTYARALEKLYRANAVPIVLGQKRGHYPDLYDRMIASGLVPDYPRPSPPSGWWALAGLVVMVVGSIAGGFGLVGMARTIG